MVRCKFRLNEVTEKMGSRAILRDGKTVYEPCSLWDAKFAAVYSEDPNSENRKFWDATPSGSFIVTTIREMP